MVFFSCWRLCRATFSPIHTLASLYAPPWLQFHVGVFLEKSQFAGLQASRTPAFVPMVMGIV